jgi:hypothetical protein
MFVNPNSAVDQKDIYTPMTHEAESLPNEILDEIDAHADTLDVVQQGKKLSMGMEIVNMGLGLEGAMNAKLAAKNKELEPLYENVKLITEFLDHAEYAMNNTKGDQINMQEHSALLEKVRPLIPERTRKLIPFNKGTYHRKELTWMCNVFLRHKDTEISTQIDRKTKEATDIYKNLEQSIPMLKDILKRWLDLQERMVGKQIPRS